MPGPGFAVTHCWCQDQASPTELSERLREIDALARERLEHINQLELKLRAAEEKVQPEPLSLWR